MGERKKFRNVADKFRQLIEWRERARQDEDREQEEHGKLYGLRLRPGNRGDEQTETERAKQKKKTNDSQRRHPMESDIEVPPGQRQNHDDQED